MLALVLSVISILVVVTNFVLSIFDRGKKAKEENEQENGNIAITFILKQPEKAYVPILFTELGMKTYSRLSQFLNVPISIELTVLGMEMEVNWLQSLNVHDPIEVIEDGMITDVNSLYPMNELSLMAST